MKYDLATGPQDVIEFAAAALEPNSTMAAGKSELELFRGAFRAIGEVSLKKLVRMRYCPVECRLDLDVSASSSAHGENVKTCNNRGAPVTATTRPSVQASVGHPVTSNATIGVALAALAAFIPLIVLASRLSFCAALANLVFGTNGDSADMGPSDGLSPHDGCTRQ
jgi:hypothetical protein